MKFYPIENDDKRFLLPESSISMIANCDSEYCIVYLNGVDGLVGHLPLFRGKYVFYVLKSNLCNFFNSAASPQSLESFLNGENGNSYYFISEDGYEIDGHEKCENKNNAETGGECVSW